MRFLMTPAVIAAVMSLAVVAVIAAVMSFAVMTVMFAFGVRVVVEGT